MSQPRRGDVEARTTEVRTFVSRAPHLGHRPHSYVLGAKAAAVLDGWTPPWLIIGREVRDTPMRERHPGHEGIHADWRRVRTLPASVEGGMGWRLVAGIGPVEPHVVERARRVAGWDEKARQGST